MTTLVNTPSRALIVLAIVRASFCECLNIWWSLANILRCLWWNITIWSTVLIFFAQVCLRIFYCNSVRVFSRNFADISGNFGEYFAVSPVSNIQYFSPRLYEYLKQFCANAWPWLYNNNLRGNFGEHFNPRSNPSRQVRVNILPRILMRIFDGNFRPSILQQLRSKFYQFVSAYFNATYFRT